MLNGLYHLKRYSITCVKRPLSRRPKIIFQDQLSLNAGQKYYRMLQREHSAILLAFIKLPFVSKIFVLSIFEWPFYTEFTVPYQIFKTENVQISLQHDNNLVLLYVQIPIQAKC